jgi:hypothetical protein
MQGPCLLENDIREVLSRMIRLESAIATLTINATQSQQHQWQAIQQVQGQVAQLREEQRAFQVALSANASVLDKSRSPLLSSREPSPDQHCGFPQCTIKLSTSNRPCSAAQSLRHMVECTHCPNNQSRFLNIAEHMNKFSKSPRVVPVDICCWCGQNFSTILATSDSDTPDARSRHRKSCQVSVIGLLRDPVSHDAAAQMLAATWNTANIEESSPLSKRIREETLTLPRRVCFEDSFLPLDAVAEDKPDFWPEQQQYLDT